MKIYFAILTSLIMAPWATAGGSLSWVEVSQRLTKECPKLLVVINQCFDVSPAGGALRLGPRSVDVTGGRADVGDRVPPYQFDCKPKGSADPYPLTIEISDWDDGWKFTIREKQMKKPAERAGSGQPVPKLTPEINKNPKPESEAQLQ